MEEMTASAKEVSSISQQAVADGHHTLGDIKAVTGAGTGCGGCIPLVTSVLNAELAKSGIEVKNDVCEHFAYSRQELFHLIRIEEIKTFDELLEKYGKGYGCEVCKPLDWVAVAVPKLRVILYWAKADGEN